MVTISRRRFLEQAGLGMLTAAIANNGRIALAAQFSPPGTILLNSNENPYGPVPGAKEAMAQALLEANRYPDAGYEDYVRAVAAFHKVSPNHVLAGNGSTELLRMAADAFTGPGRKLIIADPTFEAIEGYASARSAQVVSVPLTKTFAHDLNRMLWTARDGGGLVYLCNPNNPTGSLTARADIEAFVSKLPPSFSVLIDEAYHEFATGSSDYLSFLDKPVENPRVIVVRTFSKVYGMAGLRLGYGIAATKTIAQMKPYQLYDNLNAIAARGGMAALDDVVGVREATERNARDRADFMKKAAARRLTFIPSYTNFVMLDSPIPTQRVVEHFRRNKIMIGRDFHFGQRVRVSLGKPDEMAAFWRVWDDMARA
ncbi:MAG TPA: aminotransferase class I/II-fold pyridoxal phosphate-dependent enzyme [Terriglobales bacterium]|nr:aminotransferase class I/II-fold pyridoxal phosphate-dependent enzyme [Terriglobales bacterium]